MVEIDKMVIEGMDMAKSWLEEELHRKTDMLSLYKNGNEKVRKQFLSMIKISVRINADIAWWRNNHRDILITEILNDTDNAEHVFVDELGSNMFRAEYLNYLLKNRNHTKRELWNHMIDFIKEGSKYVIKFKTDYAKIMDECEDGKKSIPIWYFDLPHFVDFRIAETKESGNGLAGFAYIDGSFILYMNSKKNCSEKVKQEFDLSDKDLSETIMGYITEREIIIYQGPSGKMVPLASLPANMMDDISEIIELYDMDHTPIAIFNGLDDEGIKEPVGILHKSNFIF